MKHSLAVFMALIFFTGAVYGKDSDFSFKVDRKKLDAEKSQKSESNISREEWAYVVHIENKAFKDLKDLKVKYIVFVNDAIVSKSRSAVLKRVEGSADIPELKNNGTFEFTTDSAVLEKKQLKGGWTYTDGSRPRTADSIAGIWVRIYDGDKITAEYANPPAIKDKQRWELPKLPGRRK